MKKLALLACAIALTSCAMMPPRAPPIVDGRGDTIALVWIQDDPRLPADAVLDGCAYWNPMKIRCERTLDASAAHVRYFVSEEKCEDKDHHKLAWAEQSGNVRMVVDCLKGFLGLHPDYEYIRSVAAHEFGHELGIWQHVPSTCDPVAFQKEHDDFDKRLVMKTHPSGKPICGIAVMNPTEHHLKYLTEFDRLAFDIRDPDVRAVSMPGQPPPDWEGCILYPSAK